MQLSFLEPEKLQNFVSMTTEDRLKAKRLALKERCDELQSEKKEVYGRKIMARTWEEIMIILEHEFFLAPSTIKKYLNQAI